MITQTIDIKKKSKPQFQKCCSYCHKSNCSFSNCLRKQGQDKERKRKFCSRSKSTVKSFKQYFKANQNQIQPSY